MHKLVIHVAWSFPNHAIRCLCVNYKQIPQLGLDLRDDCLPSFTEGITSG